MINHHQRALLAWDILIKLASIDGIITYKELGNKIGIHYRAIRFVLEIIQDYCITNNLPPITILIGDSNGIPGTGFTAWSRDNIDEGKIEVYKHSWSNLENPFKFAIDGTEEEEIINTLLKTPQKSEAIFSKIKSRGMSQIIFRKALLKAYNCRCSFCDITFKSILQAGHIIPWSVSNDSQKLDVRNGMLLCANHHCLFDTGVLIVDASYTIRLNKKIILRTDNDKSMISSVNNKKMILPKDTGLYPNVEYLKYHFNLFN